MVKNERRAEIERLESHERTCHPVNYCAGLAGPPQGEWTVRHVGFETRLSSAMAVSMAGVRNRGRKCPLFRYLEHAKRSRCG